MFLMILLGIFAGMFVRNLLPADSPAYVIALTRLAILPLIMGVGYEILMIAGKHDNLLTRIISAPGIWVQRITTKEPTDDMLEVAITSLKCALRAEFPEFEEFYASRAWEAKTDAAADGAPEAEPITADGAPATEAADGEPISTDAEPTGAASEQNANDA